MKVEEYKNKLSEFNYLSKEEEDEITSKYKTTTPDSWTDKIKKDASNLGDSVVKLFETNDVSDIAENIQNNTTNKPKVELSNILPNENLDMPKIIEIPEESDSILNKVESSFNSLQIKQQEGYQMH